MRVLSIMMQVFVSGFCIGVVLVTAEIVYGSKEVREQSAKEFADLHDYLEHYVPVVIEELPPLVSVFDPNELIFRFHDGLTQFGDHHDADTINREFCCDDNLETARL